MGVLHRDFPHGHAHLLCHRTSRWLPCQSSPGHLVSQHHVYSGGYSPVTTVLPYKRHRRYQAVTPLPPSPGGFFHCPSQDRSWVQDLPSAIAFRPARFAQSIATMTDILTTSCPSSRSTTTPTYWHADLFFAVPCPLSGQTGTGKVMRRPPALSITLTVVTVNYLATTLPPLLQ